MVTAGLWSTRGVQRSARATAKLAWLLCGLALALLAAALLVLLIGRPSATSATDPWQRQAADLLSLIGAPLLGGLIAARRPDNRYGWLWLAVGLAMAVGAFTAAYGAVALASGPARLPGRAVAAWLGGLAFTAFLSLFPFVFLLFPNGRLPSPRWRPWAWAIIVIGALMLISVAFVPGTAAEGVANPFGIGGWLGGVLDGVVDPGIGVLTLAIAVSGLSMLLRFRRARGVERQQLKWFAFAAALLAAFLISQTPPLGLQTFGLVDLLLETLTIAGVYAGIAIAVLRYRLYEIDRLANRTLVYGTLTALLGLVYAVGVFGLGGLLNPTGEESALAVAASTLAVAALFQPARRRASRWWTAASTAAAMTPPRPSMRSSSGCATRWTWIRSRPSCWRWSTRPWSRPWRRCGCDRRWSALAGDRSRTFVRMALTLKKQSAFRINGAKR